MRRILLDTDIGNDIDDALCLAYLAAHPECDLLGVTVVCGEPQKRAEMASAILHRAGKPKVPIHLGASRALLVEELQKSTPQATALGTWPRATSFPDLSAVEFLRQTIRQNPGEIDLLSIGPMTNVALLFALDPEIPSLLRGFTSMVGIWSAEWSEWNARCDPHAAKICFDAAVPGHRAVSLDTTTKVVFDAQEARERLKCPLLEPVLDFAEVWLAKEDKITFHDPLAVVCLFVEDIVSFTPGRIEVALNPEAPRDHQGQTILHPGDGPHLGSTQVDPEKFFEHYLSVVQR